MCRHKARPVAISWPAPLVLACLLGPASLAHADDGTWSDLAPPERGGHAAIYDATRDRMVIFGGSHPSGGTSASDDTWTLRLAPDLVWTRHDAAPAPPPRSVNITALYVPSRDEMLLVLEGGRNGVWSLSLATMTWQLIVASGTPPPVLFGASSIYDPVLDRVLVFGGEETCPHGPCPLNEVWELSLGGAPAWSTLAVAGTPPAERAHHAAIYDPIRGRMIIFAGAGAFSAPLSDVWALDLAGTPTWVQLIPSGTAPPPDGFQSLYDPVGDRMLVSRSSSGPPGGLWALSLVGAPAWSALATSGGSPGGRWYPSLVYDSARGRLIMHGGGGAGTAGETWALSLDATPTWAALIVLPPPRGYTTAVLDNMSGNMVVFGGRQQIPIFNDTWARNLVGNGLWTALTPAGTPPSPRWSHSAIIDDLRHRMVVFGGIASSNFNDVWALTLGAGSAWSPIVPTGVPPLPRDGHVAAYDPVGDQMVVFGGAGDTLPQNTFNDTWLLSFKPSPHWTQVTPTGTPPSGRFWMGGTFDTKRRRLLVFGGVPITTGGELWSLSLDGTPTWSQLVVPLGPPACILPTLTYDRITDRLIVFGGLNDGGSQGNATWALTLSGTPTWTKLAPTGGPPAQRFGHAAVFDAPRDRMVAFGGSLGGDSFDDTWDLAFVPPATDVPPASPTAMLALLGAHPNPASRQLSVSLSLAERGPARLELVDVTGRRVLARDVSEHGPGTQIVTLDREVAGLPTGLYLLRLRQGPQVATAKVCVVR